MDKIPQFVPKPQYYETDRYTVECNDEVIEWLEETYPYSPNLAYDWSRTNYFGKVEYTVSEAVYLAMILKFS